ITAAPSDLHGRTVLWNEIRLQRKRAALGGFKSPQAPHLYASEDHYAIGFTTDKGESFQGRHHERMFFIFDEAIALPDWAWHTTKTMFQQTGKHFWLCLSNPTDVSSQMYSEYLSGGWNIVTMGCLEHPNIISELAGQDPPYPAAVRLSQVRDWVREW